jgi:hypothetical protein
VEGLEGPAHSIAAIDHIFVCTERGAPAADRLVEFGLTEGPPNRHPGQGTANRRFFFDNFMLEFLWVEDPAEAQSEQTRRMRLWERWSAAPGAASPFGIILCPVDGGCPFASWRYAPASMPGLVLDVAADAGLDEPMWCYMSQARSGRKVEHPAGIRALSGVRLGGPPARAGSVTTAMARRGAIELVNRREHLLELEFDGRERGVRTDFRPALPLVFLS